MMLQYLIALIPALAWGSTGLFSTKLGGSAGQQTLGMTVGAMAFGLLTFIGFVVPNQINAGMNIWIVGLLSGLLWAVGQAGQFTAIKAMGVSNAIPWSTAGQIVGNAALAATVLGEWSTAKMWIFGTIAIFLVVVGAMLTAKRDKAANEDDMAGKTEATRGLIAILISTAGYAGYFIIPNLMRKVGYISSTIANRNHGVDYMTATIFPQSIGMVIGAFLIVIFFMREASVMFQAPTWRNMLTGAAWGVGNLAMFISAATIGQAVAVTMSQMGIIVGTFGGIFILHERKTSTQMKFIVIGSIMIVAGGILISNLPK
ncbi:glucose uptake protein [Weissella beninensis]|uniref:Glucose transporter n=1 Tax=Periweissella beninensis TaxID=504936 RepID=A0ABT0VFR4_9LACO|nr:GRP family sugar transporter [Periweissella beninensis]MBM7543683.1 glucose uptake protein [Periweissella beninensis]MCM2436663.1 glucose transporter [Periweissella beninensis]